MTDQVDKPKALIIGLDGTLVMLVIVGILAMSFIQYIDRKDFIDSCKTEMKEYICVGLWKGKG